MIQTVLAIPLGFALCIPGLCAQDPTPKKAEATAKVDPEAAALLHKSLLTMQNLEAVRFKTSEEQDPALVRRFKKQMGGLGGGGAIEVEGKVAPGRTHLMLDDGGQEVVTAGSRSIARKADGAWHLHRGTLANGAALPFVLDPQQLFEVLAGLGTEARHVLGASTVKYQDREARLVTFEVTGKEGKALARTGLLPLFTGGPMMLLGPGQRPNADAAEASFDFAMWIEPGTGNILRMRTRGFRKDANGGNVQIRIGGPGGEGADDDEEEDEKADAKSDALTLKDGLPDRGKRKDVSEFDFDTTFMDHGKVAPLDLPKDAQALLRLPTPR